MVVMTVVMVVKMVTVTLVVVVTTKITTTMTTTATTTTMMMEVVVVVVMSDRRPWRVCTVALTATVRWRPWPAPTGSPLHLSTAAPGTGGGLSVAVFCLLCHRCGCCRRWWLSSS